MLPLPTGIAYIFKAGNANSSDLGERMVVGKWRKLTLFVSALNEMDHVDSGCIFHSLSA